MINKFDQIQFDRRVFNDDISHYTYQIENILLGAGRKVPLLCGKFVSLIKAIIRQPILKFRVKEGD